MHELPIQGLCGPNNNNTRNRVSVLRNRSRKSRFQDTIPGRHRSIMSLAGTMMMERVAVGMWFVEVVDGIYRPINLDYCSLETYLCKDRNPISLP
ncbi:hypothetical protein PIB30_083695 [Stylosanthes scabra]|uniref:Uncharacterized protein n=1 Tax=Stylosanthes scabra TaxID=79078 RepID=A0ABU6VW04_9FABA|nr:hypothetical protein [Stylosanthes scabra]